VKALRRPENILGDRKKTLTSSGGRKGTVPLSLKGPKKWGKGGLGTLKPRRFGVIRDYGDLTTGRGGSTTALKKGMAYPGDILSGKTSGNGTKIVGG